LRSYLLAGIMFMVIIFGLLPKPYCGDDSDFNPFVTFKMASQFYVESLFNEASQEYKEIISYGYESGNLYYNLGNTYFKMGSLGNAILNYERAKRLMPHDSDMRANLDYAYSIREIPQIDTTRLRLMQMIDNSLDAFSIDSLTKTLSFIYLSIISLLTLLIFKKKSLKKPLLTMVVILCLSFLVTISLLSINVYRWEYVKSGIILPEEADARFEPRSEATSHFRLYAGSKIRILKERSGWSQIRREDGKIGWIETSSYGII